MTVEGAIQGAKATLQVLYQLLVVVVVPAIGIHWLHTSDNSSRISAVEKGQAAIERRLGEQSQLLQDLPEVRSDVKHLVEDVRELKDLFPRAK